MLIYKNINASYKAFKYCNNFISIFFSSLSNFLIFILITQFCFYFDNLILFFVDSLEIFLYRSWFWPYIFSFVSKPPTAKCAFIGAKNSAQATRRLNSPPVTLERGFKTEEAGNTHNDNRFRRRFKIGVLLRTLLNFSPRRPLCYRATMLFESSNFIRINLSRWILGLQFCRVQFSYHAWLHKLCKPPYITCSVRA